MICTDDTGHFQFRSRNTPEKIIEGQEEEKGKVQKQSDVFLARVISGSFL